MTSEKEYLNLPKRKKEMIREFESLFGIKLSRESRGFDKWVIERHMLFEIWYSNKTGYSKIKNELMKFYEETEHKISIRSYDKLTKQYMKWKSKHIPRFIEKMSEDFEKFVKKIFLDYLKYPPKNIKQILKSPEWEMVFWEDYTHTHIDNFKEWYMEWVKKKMPIKRVGGEAIVEYRPTKLIIDNSVFEDYSKSIKKIGYVGEEYVFYEILPRELEKNYPNCDIKVEENILHVLIDGELKVKIVWNNKFRESGLSFDLKMDINGNEYFIEVKATKSNDTNFTMSLDEFNLVKEKKDKYILYLVNNLGTANQSYYRFENFFKHYEEGYLEKRDISFRIKR